MAATTTTTTATTATMAAEAAAFDAESIAMVSQQRLQRAVYLVLHESPRIQQHPAVQQARQLADWAVEENAAVSHTQDTGSSNKKNQKNQKNKNKTSATGAAGATAGSSSNSVGAAAESDVARAYLNAMASCLVQEEFLWVILKHLRAFCLDLMARLMDSTTLTLYEQDKDDEQETFTICNDNLLRREKIAGTLATLLAFCPQTKHLVLQYFIESPCFFEYVAISATQQQQQLQQHKSPIVRLRLRRIVVIAYRVLQLYPHEMAPIWNWASVYPLCFHEDLRVRWYAARVAALVLRMSNKQRNAFLQELHVGEDAAVASRHNVVRTIEMDEHRLEMAFQTQRVELVLSGSEETAQETAEEEAWRPVPFHESLTNVFGVLIPTKRMQKETSGSSADGEAATALVPTASTKRNLQALAIALGLKRPILLAGPGGCGKTAVIRELARVSGNSDMVELHLDDQIDSKTLLGSYVCTDIPGEFTWQPGALTTAVLEGRWVVVEDIDRAPFEVLAALMPLLETREMVLPGRGELLVAHSNFQIFATTSHGHSMPKGFQESIWARVDVLAMDENEVKMILETTFTRIPSHLIAKIMITFHMVSGKQYGSSMNVWKETRRNYGRDFSLRDLLKWCKRIYAFCYFSNTTTLAQQSSTTSGNEYFYITEDERLRVVVEACDVFCAGIRDPQTRVRAATAIGDIWQVQEDKIVDMMENHKPKVNVTAHEIEIGRVHLPTTTTTNNHDQQRASSSSFVMTGHVLRLLEKLGAIVHTCEPALLIGETGCGKTTVIQHLAASMGQKLVVQNLNIQSDSSDLVGGFKPVEMHLLARPLYMAFVDLFTLTFSQKNNSAFLNVVRVTFEHKDWNKMAKGMKKALQMANNKFQVQEPSTGSSGSSSKMAIKGGSPTVLKAKWEIFDAEVSRFERQREQVESHFAFAFVEGVLVKALREGHWVLLDEINLASSDTLERISTLLEQEKSAFSLTERGDVEILKPHPNFRLFGAMNPSTDVGKKDLPPSLRNRFTEIYVDECVSPSDLQMVVHHQFKEISGAPIVETVAFYLEARKQAEERLSDGARHKPKYSLRTLCQALQITKILIQRGYGTPRALFEGFSSTFCTLLEFGSRNFLENLIKNTFAKNMKPRDLKRDPPCPGGSKMVDQFVLVSSYWITKGMFMAPRDDSIVDPVTCRKKFVLTKSVEENLRHISRAALIGKYPVLLQGPTSAGKTSLIGYLAARVGQKCVRINNHEHTDLQEYLGSYVSDANGKLAFQEGVLVDAVRNGWWIILDELNLAPSEVLEALNRLLDDNRELFLPETQETIRPHPKFMLFATQNPPGLYGGRKVLSRAFRNRFLEIQVDEVPTSELQVILQERSSLPPSYCGILIEIMKQLQFVRQQSSVFAGKSGFITTRDLLRWAERRPTSKQALAEEGYCLLAERLRKEEEKQVVKQVIEQKCNVVIDLEALYYKGEARESNLLDANGQIEHETVWGSNDQFLQVQQLVEKALLQEGGEEKGNAAGLGKISVTKALRRLFALVGKCLQNEEPVLLVGETGCGKTTVCQLYSLLFHQQLHILNCHQHTETSDFLGCLRPVRGKDKIASDLRTALVTFFKAVDGGDEVEGDEGMMVESTSLTELLVAYERKSEPLKKKMMKMAKLQQEEGQAQAKDEDEPMEEVAGATAALMMETVDALKRRYQSIFEWADGPLVESMKKGDLILIDEVNLAEDAVLERLNSVLEPSRTLLLAEKGGDHVEEIVAHNKWRIMATMNPGGDFGKRELSPALRNRFTEIWVPAISDLDDIATIIHDRLVGGPRRPQVHQEQQLAVLCDPILTFVQKFNAQNGHVGGCGAVTLRDILSWINFICAVMKKQQQQEPADNKVSVWTSFVQGAALSILDGLGLGSDKALHTALKARDDAYAYLLELVPNDDASARNEVLQSLHATKQAVDDRIAALNSDESGQFGISPFWIPRGPDALEMAHNGPSFSLKAPTTMSNLYRVLRAMQVNRPIILEGSPGVGKTSLVSALAKASGHRLVRINLSEQTDISDLFGSDLPAAASSSSGDQEDQKKTSSTASEDSNKGMFEWCDGVFLRALKAGDWVLLDELNLASQSVLEGLNSCLDHRGTVYIPELDKEFECPPSFRVFAAQNPLRQGGGRKGLPKSFLNRFTRVFVDTLHEQDLTHIATSIYPQLHVAPPATAADAVEDEEAVEEALHALALVQAQDQASEPKTILERMIQFNSTIHADTMEKCTYGRLGAPWEFNLRDVFRFCELINQDQTTGSSQEKLFASLAYYVNFIYVERMRSSRDRAFVSKRFAEFFDGAQPQEIHNVLLRVTETEIQIGRAFLQRRKDQLRVSRVVPPVFNFLLKPMEALVHCVNLNWPALLVGAPASGKTSAVRLLAALSGNKLHELGMSAGTDATELLGCFEQVDLGRKLRETKDEIGEIVDVVVQEMLRKAAASAAAGGDTKKAQLSIVKQARQLSNQWFALVKHDRDMNEAASSTGGSSSPTMKKKKRQQITKGQLDPFVVETLSCLLSALGKAVEVINAQDRFAFALAKLAERKQQVVALSKSSAASVASSFEWVDGTLIQAMERGEWILLDNVNFCSSSVLDRLNSLMETGGELLINECGVINGKLRVVKPHQNFRIFLAMDAQYGEVSRAMRNRCVEIALLDSHNQDQQPQQPRDLVVMACSAGVPGFALSRGFEQVHCHIEKAFAQNPSMGARVLGRFSRRHLENWALLASREIQRGVAAVVAIERAFDRVYGDSEDLLAVLQVDKKQLLEKAFQSAAALMTGKEDHGLLLQLPVSTTYALCQRAESVLLKKDFAYVDYLLRLSTQSASSSTTSVVRDQLLSGFCTEQPDSAGADAVGGAAEQDLALVDFVQAACGQLGGPGHGGNRVEAICPSDEILATAQRHVTSIEFFPFGGASLSVLFAPFALKRLVQVVSSTTTRLVTEERLLFAMETIVGGVGGNNKATNPLDASAYLLYRFLQSLLSNKQFKACASRMRTALKTLLATIPSTEDQYQYPVYLSANASAFQQLEKQISMHRAQFPSVVALWEEIVSVQGQLELLDGSEWLRFCEEEQYQQIDLLLAPSKSKGSTNEEVVVAEQQSAKRLKKQAAFDGDLAEFSVLQQSYAVHQYHADRSSISNSDVVFLVFPFFKAFDNWLASVLDKQQGDDTAEQLKKLVRDRFEFSIQMRDAGLDWTHFLIHWQVVKKSLGLQVASSNSREWDEVMDMKDRLDHAIEKVIGCTSRKNALWKKGGHALLPRTSEMWNAKFLLEKLAKTHMQLNGQHFSSSSGDQQVDVLALLFGGVTAMEAAMKTGQLDVSSLFYVDASSRREILHALCAFSYLSKQQQQQQQQQQGSSSRELMMAEELLQVPDVLLQKLEASQQTMTSLVSSKTLYLSELEDTGANQHLLDFINSDDAEEQGGRVGRDAPILLFDMNESARLVDQLVDFQLAPLKEHALARQEVHVVAQLVHVVNVAQWSPVLQEEEGDEGKDSHAIAALVRLVRDALHNVEALLDALVDVGLRNPATFHAYQDIVWCGHRFLTASTSSSSEEVDELRGFVQVVASQLNSVLCGFHQFLRANSFNAMEAIALEIYDTQSKRRLQQKNKKQGSNNSSRFKDGDDDEDDLELHHTVVHGLPRVFQSVGTAVVLRSIAEVDLHISKCATIETPVRMLRMQKIKDHLRAMEMKKQQKEKQVVPEATKTLLTELFLLTLTAFKSTFQEQDGELQRVLSRWLLEDKQDKSLTAEDRKAFLRVLRSSSDAGFASLVDAFALPLVDLLLVVQKKSPSPLALGEALVLVGLWRFLLLLPSSPVDPVTKPLVKKEMLMNRVAMCAFQVAVDGAIHRLAPLPDRVASQRTREAQETTKLTADVRHVSAYAIQRFNPAAAGTPAPAVSPTVFGDLFRDLQRFQKTIMPAEKLLAFVGVTKTLKAKTKCRQVLRELEMFQQTTDSFVSQLVRKYGTCFYDIIEPLCASVGAVKEGIAMLSWHLVHHLQQLSAKDSAKRSVAMAVIQFPRAPMALAPQADKVFDLIRLVGSNVSALACPSSSRGSLVAKRATDIALLNVALTKMASHFRETLRQAAAASSSSGGDAAAMALRTSKAIFDLFLAKWQEQKQREDEKRKEDEALFKYKTRELQIESEDELLEQEFRQQFPEYTSNDFGAFLLTSTGPGPGLAGAGASVSRDGELWVSDSLTQELCEMHATLYAACSATVSRSVYQAELIDSFAKCFSLAVNLRKTINSMAPSFEIEQAAVSSSLFASSLVESRLTVSQAPPMSLLNSEYIRGIDFHRDPIVKEVVLVTKPLQNLMTKVHKLLGLWPDHAILQQIVLICDRIRNFEISSPLVRTLSAVELLVRKAQEWESYAARDFSIADDLKALSTLITRWRKLELYSWPHLLYVKEKQHRAQAQKTWFHMYSLLTAQFEGDATGGDGSDDVEMVVEAQGASGSKKEHQWLLLNDVTGWLFATTKPGSQASSSDLSLTTSDAQHKWRSELFATMDAYVRTCPMGQYESRLLIVYAFCSQLFMEFHHGDSGQNESHAQAGLANVLYHLYRYYAQHLGFLDRQWSALKAPIQKQLTEFVKICKWDEQTYYSLEESAEKSHRKLMKFVRDYDAVLTVGMQTVIDASTDSGISKDGGFVGLSNTKAELDRFGDGVFVPLIETPAQVTKASEDGEGEEQGEGEELPVAKPVPKPAAKVVKPFDENEPSAAGIVVVVTHSSAGSGSGSGEHELAAVAPSLVFLSTYASKVPMYSKRIAKYTSQQILHVDNVKQRQLPREICEELCSTIFYRMALLQHDGNEKDTAKKLPKGAKKKALIDLLAELKAQGLAYHRMQLPSQQQQMEQLFALDIPDVENCLQVDGLNDLAVILEEDEEVEDDEGNALLRVKKTKNKKGRKMKKTSKKSKNGASKETTGSSASVVAKDSPLWLWRRADDYYYRFVSQIVSLRFASLTQFSHDLSSSEVDRMNGYAENMLFRMLQQRQLLHATSLSHEQLLVALQKLRDLHTWRQNYLDNSETAVAVSVAIEWQAHQQQTASSVREPLKELEVVVSQVASTSANKPIGSLAQAKFNQLQALLEHVEKSFESVDADSGRVLRKSLGAPGIPFHASLSSDDQEREGQAGLVAFAHPHKRVHGVSPAVPTTTTADELPQMVVPVSVAVLEANRDKLEKVYAMLLDVRASFALVAPTAPFDALVEALQEAIQQEKIYSANVTNQQATEQEEENEDEKAKSTQSMEQFAEQFDKLVSVVLVAIQDLTKDKKEEKEEEVEDELSLRDQLSGLTSSVKNARIHAIATQLDTVLAIVSSQYKAFASSSSPCSSWRMVLHESLRLLEIVEPMILDMRGISRQLLTDLLVAHKSVSKLDYILIRIFRNLFQHGFCRSAEDGEDGENGSGDGKTKFTDDVDGTGMGEGEGKKDVSNEIEDEEQLLGLKGDENEQKPPEEGEKPEDTGLEMQNDFEGTMHDVPEDEKNENEDDEEENDEEELDREMGDFDQDDENVVDEKKWGEDSEDDEDQIDKENEKFEDNSRMDGSEAIEDEIRGKEDQEEENQSKKEEENKKKEDEKSASKEPDAGQDSDEGGGEDSDEENKDGEDGEDEENEDGQKDPVNDDFEDNYEEKHDQVDPNSRDGEQEEEKEEDQEGDELPENMQLDGDDEDGDGDDEGGDDKEDEDMDMDPEDLETNGGPDDEEEKKEEDENKEEEEPLDNAVQLGAGGMDDEQDAPEDEENAEPEEDKNKPEENDATDQQKSSSAVAGTQSKDGVDELDQEELAEENEDEDEENDPSKPENNDAEDDQNENQKKKSSSQSQSNDKDDQQDWRPTSQLEQDQPRENEEQKRNRRKQEPNPYRNPQNAQEHWKRRVEMIQRDEENKNDQEENRESGGDREREMTTAELLDDDDETEDARHALAPAEEQQVMNQQNQANDDEDESKKEQNEDDEMDGAGAAMMEMEEDKAEKKEENEEEENKSSNKSSKPDRDSKKKQEDADADSEKPQEDKASEDQEMKDRSLEDAEDAKLKDHEDFDMENDEKDGGALSLQQPGDQKNKSKEQNKEEEEEEDQERAMPKLLSPDQVVALREELDLYMATWSSHESASRGAELWSKYTSITMGASQRLCEQLRLVLEPMLRAKLEGDFRTGKRINMRKVIPYIASQFRKDKIWMRRTRPSKRAYQIMVAIDDSESMADNHAGRLALEAMTTLCKALTQLEVGEISVVKFGQDIELLHAFDAPFTDDAGSRVITQFGFQQKKTNMITTLDTILQILDTAKQTSGAASANANVEFTQIVFLISDGRFDTDGRTRIKKLIEKALEQQQLIVLLVVDHAQPSSGSSGGAVDNTSILETKSVTFTKGKVEMVPYLENYPFPYYVILPTSTLLPEILSDSLRQWFEMLQMKQ